MAADAWFIARDGKQQGPVGYADLLARARSGAIHPTDLIWKEGMLEWQPAERVGGLFEGTGRTPPPVPSQPLGYANPHLNTQAPLGEDARMRMLLPVGRSGWAIAAGYLGLLSVLLLFAPLALLIGILAVRDIRRNPHRHGMGRAVFGIVMGAVFCVPLVYVLLLLTFGD